MKKKTFAFWICRPQECQKNPLSQNTIHNYQQKCFILNLLLHWMSKGFWENLKGYYYTIGKSMTWKLSVVSRRVFFCVTYSAYFCKTLIKGFTIQKVIFIYSDNNFQTVIFMRWCIIIFRCVFFRKIFCLNGNIVFSL